MFHETGEPDTVRRYGIGAQQVLGVLDGRKFNGIHLGEDGFYGANYSEFIAPIISSIQTLANENERLSKELARLSARLARLDASN